MPPHIPEQRGQNPLQEQLASGIAWLAALSLGILASCSKGDGPGVPRVSTLTVLSTNPADGATDVEPGVEITLEIALPQGGTAVGDITSTDGVHELPGSLAHLNGTTWRWTPDRELPRGGTIRLISRSQGQVAQFKIREANQSRDYFLPGATSDALLMWPNGRAAVRASDRWYEVTASGLSERFVELGSDASTFGDGEAVWIAVDANDRWLVRTGLDGERDRVRMPGNDGLISTNRFGDVVLFLHSDQSGPYEAGFWVLWHDQSDWELAGAIKIPTQPPIVSGLDPRGRPQIDAQGSVSIAYRFNDGSSNNARFWRFARDEPLPEQYELATDGTPTMTGIASDGSGWIVWAQAVTPKLFALRAVRYQPGVGIGEPTDIETWQMGAAPVRLLLTGLTTSRAGSAIVQVLATGTILVPGYAQNLRIEGDGWHSSPVTHYARYNAGTLTVSPERGELWTVWAHQYSGHSEKGRVVNFRRSQPGAETEPLQELYRLPDPTFKIGSNKVCIDDSGRAVLYLNELGYWNDPVGTRIVVVE